MQSAEDNQPATKGDICGIREDLKGLATKDDIKDALSAFKADLVRELNASTTRFERKIDALTDRIDADYQRLFADIKACGDAVLAKLG